MVNEKKKKFVWNEIGKSWLLLCLTSSFMVSVFAPLENYFANKTEFWFELHQILPVIVSVFLLAGVFSWTVCYIVRNSKYNVFFYSLWFCCLMFFYVQGNYIPRNYGVLNGVDIDWDGYTSYAVASIVLIIVFIVLLVILILKIKEKIYLIGKWVCTILILLQIVTIGTLYIQNDLLAEEGSNKAVVTTNGMFELSSERNILVFILDTFDSSYMMSMLEGEKGETYKEIFENFTYYPDTLGAYPTTKGALPHILTGQWYENEETYVEYIRGAYTNNTVHNVMKENKYSMGFYTSPTFVSPQGDMYKNIIEGNYVVGDHGSLAGKLYKLVAFNYMPHQLKKYFYITTAEFDNLKETQNDYVGYSEDVQNFYKIFSQKGVSLIDEENSFRVYHLEGVHPPYTFDENLQSDVNETYGVYDEVAGNFKLLEDFFYEIKEEGIYDTSTIIIMADHGSLGLSQNPLFMIKNAGEQHAFEISDKKMSYEYLEDIFISLAKEDNITENVVAGFGENEKPRRYLYYLWDDVWDRQYLPTIVEYRTTQNAMDASNLTLTGRNYIAEKDMDYSYSLNKELSFGEEETANKYCLFGFSQTEGKSTWTDGKSAAMYFELDGEYEALELSMEYHVYSGKQRVIVYANDNIVADYEAQGDEKKIIYIPKEYISDSELTLSFEFPDAISPKEKGENDDGRELALSMRNMKFSSVKSREYAFVPEYIEKSFAYKLGEKVLFTEEDTASKYIMLGFSGNEGTHTWTDGYKAEMLFEVMDNFETLEMVIEYSTFMESQRVRVCVNEYEVANYIASGKEKRIIYIPSEYVKENKISLCFELPDAKSPKLLGTGNDERLLALALKSIQISVAEDRNYTLGEELSFLAESTAEKYCVYGFSGTEGTKTWTEENEALMYFTINEPVDVLELTMEYNTYTEEQQVIVYVNNQKVADYQAVGKEKKTLIIPSGYVKGNVLLLKFEFPDADSPLNRGEGTDSRALALAMKSITITSVEAGEN